MRKSKIITITLFIIVLLVILFLFTQQNKKGINQEAKSPLRPISVEPIKQKPGAPPMEKSTEYSFDPMISPPIEAWIYSVASQGTVAALLSNFVSAIGLPPKPTIQKGEETLFIWNNETSSVLLNESPTSSSLQYQQLKGGVFRVDSPTTNGVNAALLVMFPFLPKETNVSGSFSSFKNIHVLFQDPQPSLVMFKGSFSLGEGFPIFSGSFSSVSLTITIDEKKYIRTLSVFFPPLSFVPIQKKPVISLETALESLNNQKGALSSVSSLNGSYLEHYPTLKQIRLMSYVIGYDRDKNNLYPVFLFRGVGISEDQTEYNVEVSLRATE